MQQYPILYLFIEITFQQTAKAKKMNVRMVLLRTGLNVASNLADRL